MEDVILSRDEVFNVHEVYERKASIEDLCLLLSSKNSLVKEGNLFYEKLLLDNIDCIRRLESFWARIIDMYEIELKEDEEVSLDFYSRRVIIKKKSK